MDSIGLEVGI